MAIAAAVPARVPAVHGREAASYPPTGWPANSPPACPSVLVLALSPAAAQQALLDTVTRLSETHPRRRRYRLAVPFGTALFPPDHLLREAPGWPADAAIDTWLALPPSQRRHDVLLLPDEDYYWHEPGAAAGDYAAQFIVHLAHAPAGSAVSLFQVHARRRHGKVFRLLGRAGPGFYWDIRPATPSQAAVDTLAGDLARWLPAATCAALVERALP